MWRFEHPDFSQATYTMDFSSTRFMFDLGLTVMAIEQFSIYALAGVGVAYNDLGFNALSNPGLDCPIEDLNLQDEKSSGFAYEFGAGMSYAATDSIAISLEYLFTRFNDVELGDGNIAQFEVDGTDMDIDSQAVLLGLRFAL